MRKFKSNKSQISIGFLVLMMAVSCLNAQNTDKTIIWRQALRQSSDWYSSKEAVRIADNLLIYQTKSGGWPKNIDMARILEKSEIDRIVRQKNQNGTVLSHATMDNSATSEQMRFLARVYAKTGHDRFKQSVLEGVGYYLNSQYENGGWPQFYPIRKGYYQHITYNDNAMVNTLNLLKDIYSGNIDFEPLNLNDTLIKQVQEAFDKGIQCILQTQIIVNGKPTVWCAQHDEVTLAPANARSYELASFSGAESVGIASLLMKIENPSSEVINAVNAAVKWFEEHRLVGIRVQEFVNAEGLKDRKVVVDESAPDLWARFYDLETGKPYFCDRDGIKRETFAEMGHNRRNGYSWYTNAPQKLINEYEIWSRIWNK